MSNNLEEIVALAKNRGFIFPGSEIYGGLANTWDYGPLGVELKNNIKKAWWKKFIQEQIFNFGLDSSILLNPEVWNASGHLNNFSDPLIDCKNCKTRFRADKLIEDFLIENNLTENIAGWDNIKLFNFIRENNIKCPECESKNFTEIRNFNLMFKTFMGVTDDNKIIYLRPETAQGIFINFNNVLRTTRKKLPFGIGQIGKSFRNEITPGNFIFRTREFEQMELEFFCTENEREKWFTYWKNFCFDWLINLNLSEKNLRIRDHQKEELSHYSNATSDIEYLFPFGWGELWGIADRGNFDLSQHEKFSHKEIKYFDSQTNQKFIPNCIEPSLGADRVTLAFLCDAYNEENLENNDSRVVLKLHPFLSPIKIAVLPLSKKLSPEAIKIYDLLSKYFVCDFDETGSIGKRYRRQDEIGTPFCLTYDFDSQTDDCVTIRERDSMNQERIKIDNMLDFLNQKLFY